MEKPEKSTLDSESALVIENMDFIQKGSKKDYDIDLTNLEALLVIISKELTELSKSVHILSINQ